MNKNEKKHQFKSFFPISADAMNRMPGQEKTTKRTRSSKIFDLGRNLHQAVLFAAPVHYRDKHTGEWCEIDNTLINKADKNGNVYLTNHSNGELKVELHRTDSPYTVLLQNENNNVLSWMLEDAEVVMPVRLNRPCREHSDCDLRRDVLAHLESEVVYSNIFPDADMHCYIRSVSFKDEIIFKNKNAVRPITFLLSTPDMVPTPRENGSIDLVATSGEIVFSLPKPFMKDTSPAEKVGTVSYTLHPTSERDLWRMTYTPDVEWLKTAQFPVVLDPAVVTPSLSSGFTDLHISSNSPSSVQTSGDQLIRLARNDSTYGNITALFKYANAALPNIDSSYYVTKAFLTLKTGSVYTAQAVALKEITADWNASTVTWNSIINGISSKVSDYVYMSNSKTEYQYDISNLVRKWYTNANDNHGFALEVMGTGLIDICTSNNATFTPYLTINYTSLAGLENYLAYEQQSAGRAGTGYVSLYNGNLIFEHSDTVTNGNLLPVSLTHYYNSCDSDHNYFGAGRGWKLNLQQYLYRETIFDDPNNTNTGTTYYVYVDADGTRHHFKQDDNGKWKDQSGLDLEITFSSTAATIVDKGNNKMLFALPTADDPGNFSAAKTLKKITDARGNVMTVSTSGINCLASVQDGASRTTVLNYGTNLTSICPPGYSNGYCGFTYDSNNHLTSIWHLDGNGSQITSTYEYSTNGLLTKVTNYDGTTITYTYSSTAPYRVKQTQISKNGLLLGGRKYVYGDCMTAVTDLVPSTNNTTLTDGKTLIYHFNDYGNVVSANDGLGYGVFTEYDSSLPMNHPKRSSRVQCSVTNLLKRHDMESSGYWTEKHLNSSTGTFSYSTSRVHTGQKSLRLVKSNTSGYQTAYQTVNLVKGKTYTFSAYFTTVTDTYASIRVTYKDSTGADVNIDSTAEQSLNYIWRRVSIPFTLPANSTSTSVTVRIMASKGTGSAFFDCLQLEEGGAANSYNMLQNSDFSMNSDAVPTFWSANSANSSSDKVYATSANPKPTSLSANVLRVYGGGRNSARGFSQEVAATGKAGDIFTVGGWTNHFSKPLGDNKKHLSIRLVFIPASGSEADGTPAITWGEEWTGWQLTAGAVQAPINYSSIRFCIDYQDNVNYAEFDGMFLYKEQFGNTYEYNTDGSVTAITNMAQLKCNATYDDYNNMTSYTAYGRSSDVAYTQTWGATAAEKEKHLLRTATSPLGTIQEFSYDNVGNLTASITKNSDESLKMAGTTTYTSNNNYIATQTDSRGKTVTSNINPTLGTLTSITDPNGQTVSYTYDQNKRVTGVSTTANSKTYRNTYTYENDRIKTIAHNTTSDTVNSSTYTFLYDNAGRNTQVNAGDIALVRNVFNPNGTLASMTHSTGQSISYTYDDFKRLSTKTLPNGYVYRYYYGANGGLAHIRDEGRKHDFYFENDACNRPFRAAQINDGVNRLTGETLYDKYGNVCQIDDLVGSGRSKYSTFITYDNENRPKRVYFKSEVHRVDYSYDALGRVRKRTYCAAADEYPVSYTFLAGANGGNTTPLVSAITQDGENHSYTYDNVGNIASVTRDGVKRTYVYDNLGQLTRVNDPSDKTAGSTGTTWVYDYDRGGNILSKKYYVYTTGTLGSVKGTEAFTYGASNWGDKLVTYKGATITYTGANIKKVNGWTYSYGYNNLLTQATKGTSGTAGYEKVTFSYDALGRLYERVHTVYNEDDGKNHVEFFSCFWNGDKLVHITRYTKVGSESYTKTDKLHFYYDADGKPSHVHFNDTRFFYQYNLQGDVIGILAGHHSQIVRYEYDAWGKIISIKGDRKDNLGKYNPFRYRHYMYDDSVSLYYLKSRHYHPALCRFLQADTVLGEAGKLCSHNIYAYCGNNPILYSDPSGKLFGISFALIVTSAFVGGLVGGFSQIAMNVMTGAEWYDGVVGAVVGGVVYNTVSVLSYGDTALSAYSSAAAESFTNEVISYTPLAGDQQKELTMDNVSASVEKIANDTLINGAGYYATGRIAEGVIPLTANPDYKKTLIRTVMRTVWGKQMVKQTVVQGLYNYNYNIAKKMLLAE